MLGSTIVILIRSGDNRINSTFANNESGSPPDEVPVGFFNGDFMLPEQIRLPLEDAGITHGVMLTEQLRTFSGSPRLLAKHLERLESGAGSLSVPVSIPGVKDAVLAVVKHNFRLLPPGRDLRVSILLTPGIPGGTSPTVIVTTAELPFHQYSREYRDGIHLVAVDTREISSTSIPRHIKHRNRIHYWLAEQQAQQIAAEARALLLDQDDNICEATTASIALFRRDEGIIVPPVANILGSISLATSLELLSALGHPIVRRAIALDELHAADEIFWFSSPMCVLPVSKLNGKPTGSAKDRVVFHALMKSWNEMVGFDLVRQADMESGEK